MRNCCKFEWKLNYTQATIDKRTISAGNDVQMYGGNDVGKDIWNR